MRKKFFVSNNVSIAITILIAIIFNIHILNYNLGTPSTYTNTFVNILLNLLPIIILNFILLFIFNNFIISNGIFIIIVLILEIANIYKIKFRGAPISINDYTLIKEVFNIRGAVPTGIIVAIAIGIVFFVFLGAFLNYIISIDKFRVSIRIASLFFLIILFIICNKSFYVKKNNNMEYPYNLVNQYEINGLIYSMLYNYNKNLVSNYSINEEYLDITGDRLYKKVNLGYDFSNKTSMDILNELPIKEKEVNEKVEYPNIIFVMNEAYSDIGKNPNIDLSSLEPYINYDNICGDGFEGRMVVPNVGGGTSDTEFDMMTAFNTRFFRDASFAFEKIKEPIYAIPDALKNLGYSTNFIHPYERWYYTRDLYIPRVGFEEFMDDNSFIDAEKFWVYTKTSEVYKTVIDTIKTENEAGKPSYVYTTTIENHGPFADKYNIPSEESESVFKTTIDLTNADKNALANYLYGIKNDDEYLADLIDSINLIERPTILVFYGDHLPSLEYDCYNKIVEYTDTDIDSQTYLNQNPYLIYENTASKKNIGVIERLRNNQIPEYVSSFYVPLIVMDAAKIDLKSSFYDFLYSYMYDYPVILEDNYYDGSFNSNENTVNPYITYLRKIQDVLIKGK